MTLPAIGHAAAWLLLLLPLISGMAAIVILNRLLAWRRHLPMDTPNDRSLHSAAVPRTGGLAILGGVLLASLPAGFGPHPLPLLLALCLLLGAMSFLDDLRGLGFAVRLLVHIAVAAVWVIVALADISVAAGLGAILAVAWGVNLYNFMDGSDGLAGGMALFGFGAYAAAAWPSSPSLAIACLVVATAAAGFLVYNFAPARVFLGDAGSVPLGFAAAAIGAYGAAEGGWPVWFPVLVFSPFVVDASMTLLRRALCRELVWRPHREHYYQRLVRMGWSHRRTALAEYALMALAAGVGLMLLGLEKSWQWGGLAVFGVAMVIAMLVVDVRWARWNGS